MMKENTKNSNGKLEDGLGSVAIFKKKTAFGTTYVPTFFSNRGLTPGPEKGEIFVSVYRNVDADTYTVPITGICARSSYDRDFDGDIPEKEMVKREDKLGFKLNDLFGVEN